MPPSSARNGGDFIETKANQMSLLSCSRFSSACKPCVWIYSTDQRKIPRMSATDGRPAMPMSVLMSAHCSHRDTWRMAISRHKRILAHRALKKLQPGTANMENGTVYNLAASQTGAGCTPDPHRSVFRIYVRASHFPLSAGSGVHIRACCLNGGEAG